MTSTSFVVRTHWYHPEWPAVALAGLAWAVLLMEAAADPSYLLGSAHVHPPLHVLGHTAVMVAAMMLPLALLQVAYVAEVSLWSRRYRAVVGFVAGYLVVWTAAASASVAVGGFAVSALGWRPAIVAGFGAAVASYAVPRRRLVVRRCAMTRPLAARGWRAERDCVRYGMAVARPCVVTCWVLMTAVMIGHGLVVMAAATALGLVERRRRELPPGVGVLLVVGLGLLSLALSYGVGGVSMSPTTPGERHH